MLYLLNWIDLPFEGGDCAVQTLIVTTIKFATAYSCNLNDTCTQLG